MTREEYCALVEVRVVSPNKINLYYYDPYATFLGTIVPVVSTECKVCRSTLGSKKGVRFEPALTFAELSMRKQLAAQAKVAQLSEYSYNEILSNHAEDLACN